MKQVFGKVHDLIGAADFVIQKRQFDDVKVFVKILDLFQVFPLHLASGFVGGGNGGEKGDGDYFFFFFYLMGVGKGMMRMITS